MKKERPDDESESDFSQPSDVVDNQAAKRDQDNFEVHEVRNSQTIQPTKSTEMHIENQMSSGRGDIQEEINTSVHSYAGPVRSPG